VSVSVTKHKNLVGVVNCTIPSFTADLKAINEKAIRHDTRLAIEHGFMGTVGYHAEIQWQQIGGNGIITIAFLLIIVESGVECLFNIIRQFSKGFYIFRFIQ